jgi:hypothetical protein
MISARIKNSLFSSALLTLFSVGILFSQSWQNIGPNEKNQPGFYYSNAGIPVITSGKNEIIYEAFTEQNNDDIAILTVSKYQNGIWSVVGNLHELNVDVNTISLATDTENNPVIAYSQNGNAIVQRYTGSEWEIVGSPFPDYYILGSRSLAISKSDSIFLAVIDPAANVFKFGANGWTPVGKHDFSIDSSKHLFTIEKIQLVLNGEGEPYVIYKQLERGEGISIQHYYNGSWYYELPLLDDNLIQSFSIAINLNNRIYLAYSYFNSYESEYYTNIDTIYQNDAVVIFSYASATNPVIKFSEGNIPYVLLSGISNLQSNNYSLFYEAGNTWLSMPDFDWPINGPADFIFDDSSSIFISGSYVAGNLVTGPLLAKLTNDTWVNLTNFGITNRDAELSNICYDNLGVPYIGLFDAFNYEYEILKFVDGQWEIVGNPGMGIDIPSDYYDYEPINLVFDTNDLPYVLVGQPIYNQFPSTSFIVLKLVGNAWSRVGTTVETLNSEASTELAINPLTNQPLVALLSSSLDFFQFSGSQWERIVSPPDTVTDSYFNFSDMLIDKKGVIYIVANDYVQKYENMQWQPATPFKLSSLGAYIPRITLDQQGNLFIAFTDTSTINNGCTMMKWDGSQWNLIGERGFIDYCFTNPPLFSFKIGNDNIPYVAFRSEFNLASYNLSVKKFNGINWVFVGDTIINHSQIGNLSFDINSSGSLLIAANESRGTFAWEYGGLTSAYSLGLPETSLFSVFPNPNNKKFYLEINKQKLNYYSSPILEIYDQIGNLKKLIRVNSFNTQMRINIDLSDLPGGVYYIGIKNMQRSEFSKIIIE